MLSKNYFTTVSVVLLGLLLGGCAAKAPSAVLSELKEHRFVTLDLFDKEKATRNSKAKAVVQLPDDLHDGVGRMELELEAYNDDPAYLRAIWFQIDEQGGYIGVSHVGKSQYRGNITLKPKQQRSWILDLSQIYFNGSLHAFSETLKDGKSHKVLLWISTYDKFGPNSWVSARLRFFVP